MVFFAPVAQSVEHHHGKVGVIGSSPIGSSAFVFRNTYQEGDIMASKKKGPVEKISLACAECNRRNYYTEKNRRNMQGKLELMKYCKHDRKHTLHKESKVK